VWFTSPKFTLGPSNAPRTLRYRVESKLIAAPDDGPPIQTSGIDWQAPVDMTAEEAIAQARESARHGSPVQEFLRGLLTNGPVLQKMVMEKGINAGFSPDQLRRARTAIGAVTFKRRGHNLNSPWLWSLSEHVPADAEPEA
jgi:hypothetical protein